MVAVVEPYYGPPGREMEGYGPIEPLVQSIYSYTVLCIVRVSVIHFPTVHQASLYSPWSLTHH